MIEDYKILEHKVDGRLYQIFYQGKKILNIRRVFDCEYGYPHMRYESYRRLSVDDFINLAKFDNDEQAMNMTFELSKI